MPSPRHLGPARGRSRIGHRQFENRWEVISDGGPAGRRQRDTMGPLFGARAAAWAEKWEGPTGAGLRARAQPDRDQVRALSEARRVSRGRVVVVIPTRVPGSGITSVFKPIFRLFSAEALESVKESGMFALSESGKLEEALAAAALTPYEDDEIECPIVFDDVDTAERAFVGAGPMQLAISNSGKEAVAGAVRAALEPFTDTGRRVVLPAWYRAVIAQGDPRVRALSIPRPHASPMRRKRSRVGAANSSEKMDLQPDLAKVGVCAFLTPPGMGGSTQV
jgi:hypothetical protein